MIFKSLLSSPHHCLRLFSCVNFLLLIARVISANLSQVAIQNGYDLNNITAEQLSLAFQSIDTLTAKKAIDFMIKHLGENTTMDVAWRNDLLKNLWQNRFFFALLSLALVKALLISCSIFFTVCGCNLELTSQMFRLREATDDNSRKIQRLYGKLHHVILCEISDGIQETLREQKKFLIQLSFVIALQAILTYRVQILFETEVSLCWNSAMLSAFMLLINGNDLLLPVIYIIITISHLYLKHYLIRIGSIPDQQLALLSNQCNSSHSELACQLLVTLATIQYFANQLKEQLISIKMHQNQLMMNSINHPFHKKDRTIVAQLGLATVESEEAHGLSLSAIRNIIYLQINTLHGICHNFEVGRFFDLVTAQVLIWDQNHFKAQISMDCLGRHCYLNQGRKELPLLELTKTFDNMDLDKDKVVAFIHQNLKCSLSRDFPFLFQNDMQDTPALNKTNIKLQNGEELKLTYEDYLGQLKVELIQTEVESQKADVEAPRPSKQNTRSQGEMVYQQNDITILVKDTNFIQSEAHGPTISQREQDNLFLKKQQDSYRQLQSQKEKINNKLLRKTEPAGHQIEFTVEDPNRIHDQEQTDFEQESIKERSPQAKKKGKNLKRTSTKDAIRLFDEEAKQASGILQEQDSIPTFSVDTKKSSFEMRRHVFHIGVTSDRYGEQISSIQNSQTERARVRHDSSNPSTTQEQLAEQRIEELQDTQLDIENEPEQIEQGVQEEFPNYDSNRNIHHDSNQTISELNQEIQNKGISLQEIMHQRMMKIQGQLKNNRLFMDMVIHDMRSPTLAIQLNIQEIFDMLKTEQNKVRWIKNQRKLNINNLFGSNSNKSNKVISSDQSQNQFQLNPKKGKLNRLYQSHSYSQYSQQSLVSPNSQMSKNSQQNVIIESKSQSGSDIDDDQNPSVIMRRQVINMVYSNPSQDISSQNSNNLSSQQRMSSQHRVSSNKKSSGQQAILVMNMENIENQSVIDNSPQLQQLSIGSKQLAQMNQVNTVNVKNLNLLGFSDILSAKQKLYQSLHLQFSGTDSSAIMFSGYLQELYMINQDSYLHLFDPNPSNLSLFTKHILKRRNERPPQRSGSILRHGLCQKLSDLYQERNIFSFLADLKAQENSNQMEENSVLASQISQEEQKVGQPRQHSEDSDSDEQIPINQNVGQSHSLPDEQIQPRLINEVEAHRYPQLEILYDNLNQENAENEEPPQIVEARSDQENEEDFDDRDIDEVPAQLQHQIRSDSNQLVFNNQVKVMNTNNNQIENKDNGQAEDILKSIGQKMSKQINQIDRLLALQDDQQDQTPIVKYWTGANEQPLTALKNDFSEMVETLGKFQRAINQRSEQIAKNQVTQVIFEKPLVQTQSKATQYKIPNIPFEPIHVNNQQRLSSLQNDQSFRQPNQIDLINYSNARQGQNSQVIDQDQISQQQINSNSGKLMQDQSVQCDNSSNDLMNQIRFLRTQNHLISQKMGMITSYSQACHNKNQNLQQIMMADQQTLQEQQQMIERYQYELCAIDAQESQNKKFLDNIIKFLHSTIYQSKMMNNLINDILDLAKFESGTFKFHNDFFDLTEVVKQAFETVRHQATKKGINLEFKIKDERIQIQEATQVAHNSRSTSKLAQAPVNRSFDSNRAQEQSDDLSNINNSATSNASRANLRSDSDNHTDQAQIIDSRSTSKDAKKYFTNILGDQNRYMQILNNILGNSIHYTKKGSVTVTFILVEEQDTKKVKEARSHYILNHQNIIANNTSLVRDYNHGSFSGSGSGNEEFKQMAQSGTRGINNLIRQNETHKQVSSPAVYALVQPNRMQTVELNFPQLEINSRLQESESNSIGAQNQIYSQENLQNSNMANNSQRLQNRYNQTEIQMPQIENLSLQSQQYQKFITFRIEIKDTGVGIKQDDIPKLFTDFTRLDKNMNKKGTGLGLSICKQMVEKMGGSVEVQSQFGYGSTFILTLSAKTNTNPQQYTTTDSNIENSEGKHEIERSMINNQFSGSQNQNLIWSVTNQTDSMKFQSSSHHARISNQNEPLYRQYSMQIDQNGEDIIKKGPSSQFTLSSGQVLLNNFGSQESSLSNQMIISGRHSNNTGSENRRQNSAKGSGSYNSQITVMKIQKVQQQPLPVNQQLMANQPDQLPLIREENEQSSYIHQNNNEESKEHEQMPIQKSTFQRSELIDSNQVDPIEESKNSHVDFDENDSEAFSFSNKISAPKKPQLNKISGLNIQKSAHIDQSNNPFYNDDSMRNKLNMKFISEQISPIMSPELNPDKEKWLFKCLVANDEDFLLMANQKVLQTCNIEAIGVINGLEAYETVTIDEQWFDVIILDLNMPIMDGFTAAAKITDHFKNKSRLFSDLDLMLQKGDKINEGIKGNLKKLKQAGIYEDSQQQIGPSIDDMMLVKPLLVACTNHLSHSISNQCKDAGFDLCLTQPLTVNMVTNHIIPLLSQQKAGSAQN